jgi:hypothetical protein
MIVAEEANPGHHTAHAGGVAAILQIENNPLGLVQAILSGHPLVLNGKQVRLLCQSPVFRSNGLAEWCSASTCQKQCRSKFI